MLRLLVESDWKQAELLVTGLLRPASPPPAEATEAAAAAPPQAEAGRELLALLIALAEQRHNKKLARRLGMMQAGGGGGVVASDASGGAIDLSAPLATGGDGGPRDEGKGGGGGGGGVGAGGCAGSVTRLPPYQLEGTHVLVLECMDEAERALAPLLAGLRGGGVQPAVVGLDAEWVLGRPVSLLQLSVGLDVVLLLRLQKMAPQLPPSLSDLLEDATVVKAGVGVVADLRLLREQYGLASRGAVELQPVAARWISPDLLWYAFLLDDRFPRCSRAQVGPPRGGAAAAVRRGAAPAPAEAALHPLWRLGGVAAERRAGGVRGERREGRGLDPHRPSR